MNFVIFSYSFPPRCGAETFCSARFASALARAGHQVHVVTMAHEPAISQDTYEFFVDRRLKITRVPLVRDGRPWFSRLRFAIDGRECANFRNAIRVLSKVLDEVESPILVSRSMPLASGIVAWYCRNKAYRWIAHFSDPSPWDGGTGSSFLGQVGNWLTRRWTRRIIRDCAAVSLTCENVKQFFLDNYGKVFAGKPVTVAPHIGDPVMPKSRVWERPRGRSLVVHAGGLNFERGVRPLLEAIKSLNEKGREIEFVQAGQVDRDVAEYLSTFDFAHVISDPSPDLAGAVTAVADVSFVPDMRTALPYIPFLPSKFVYQVFGETPIVAYTMQGSAMDTYATRFPEGGVFTADMNTELALEGALESAFAMKRCDMDRTGLRAEFSQRKIAYDFTAFVSAICNS